MRDIALTLIIGGLLPLVFLHPHIGALMWVWVSMMNPHRWAFGFAHNFPFAAIIAATLLLATAFSKHRKPFPWGPITALLVVFMGWMTFTSFFAIGSMEETFVIWLRTFKIHLMLLVTFMVIRGRKHIEQLIWVIVISIGFYGLKGGIWTVLTGGVERVYGPRGGVIEGNNELALALIMIIPLMYYLMSVTTRKLVRYGLIFAILCCGFSVLGSHSRGALVAIVAAVMMLALKSRRPLLLGMLGAIALASMLAFMPEHWAQRMYTMGASGDDMDGSALSRLQTWTTLWRLALDRPIVGGGFELALTEIYTRYSPVSGVGIYASHSIYFQVLGEHGFVGLGIFLTLTVVSWLKATQVMRICRRTPGFEWGDTLMRMTQVSLLAYLVGGAFLGLLHFDLPYHLIGLIVMVEATLRDEGKAGAAKPAFWPPPSARGRAGMDAGGQSPALRRRA